VPKSANIQELVSPPEWNKKLSELVDECDSKPKTIFVCGPKSSGKSTFTKLLLNKLVTRLRSHDSNHRARSSRGVAILDLDPGQPEYSPAGTVALVHIANPNLGQPFTHPLLGGQGGTIVRQHALASVTPASDPELYIQCVLDLYSHAQATLRGCSVLINTPGWVLGTGLDILVDLISNIRPGDVIYMSEDGPWETVESLQQIARQTFSMLPSQKLDLTSRTAAQLRSMQIMSYFHSTFEEKDNRNTVGNLDWNPEPLTTIPPYQVMYAGENPGILGIICYDYQVPEDLLAESINGSILAAVEIEDEKAFHKLALEGVEIKSQDGSEAMDVDDTATSGSIRISALSDRVSTTPEGIRYFKNPSSIAIDPKYSRSLGLVLVRGIDIDSRSLHILTPISLHNIEEVRKNGRHIVLIHGKFDSPSWAYTEDLYHRMEQDETGKEQLPTAEELGEDLGDDANGADVTELASSEDIRDVPWVEVLQGHEKRPVGSKVWRVRRDLGRTGNAN
jgi:polynucleotide 5'-hydroxyl-kinase GRC3/NOL9